MTWLAAESAGITPFERVLGLRPELRDRTREYLGAVWASGEVDPVVLELCRLRIAQLHGAPSGARDASALAAGLTEDKVAALPSAHDHPAFSPHERACVAYAEKFLIDVHSLTDADADAVKAGCTEAEFVAFTVALGLLDGFGRFRLVLGVEPTDGVVPPPTPDGALH